MRPLPRLERIGQEFTAKSERLQRFLRARRRFSADLPRKAIFLVGCQRSGTNMAMWALEKAPEVWPYHEHLFSVAFRDYRLRSTDVVDRLVRKSPAPLVAFKPVCDSHLVDRLLERHAGSRAVWIYRRWPDVANSNVRNFGEHVRDILRWIVDGDYDRLNWRGERLSPEAIDHVRRVYHPEMSLEAAACVFWWLRNLFFFDLDLAEDERVLMVRYEDLVARDSGSFPRLFDFAGCRFEEEYVEDVFSSSIGKDALPSIPSEIGDACDELQERLDRALARSRNSRRATDQSS